jgi:hypothetical protein
MLQYGTLMYPTLCKEFYANILLGKEYVDTIVGGKHIKLTADILGQIIGVPNRGKTRSESTNFPRLTEACQRLKIPRLVRGSDENKVAKRVNLAKPRVHLISYLLAKNVTPKGSSYSDCSNIDIFHMYAMLIDNNITINLPEHIITTMINVRKVMGVRAIIYHLLLAKIFDHFRINLPDLEDGSNEQVMAVNTVLDESMITHHLGMQVINDQWIPKEPYNAIATYVTDLLSGPSEGHISPSNSMDWSSEDEDIEQSSKQQGNLSLEGLTQEFHDF